MVHFVKSNRIVLVSMLLGAISIPWLLSSTSFVWPDFPPGVNNVSCVIEDLDPLEQIEIQISIEQDEKKRAVLGGLLWAARFVEDDDNLDYVFSSYVLMLRELMLRSDDKFTSRITTQLIKEAFFRIEHRLDKAFTEDNTGKWDFISILPFIYQFDLDPEPYLHFYKSQLPQEQKEPYGKSFSGAVEKINYDLLGDYLIDYAFLHFLNQDYPDHGISLPHDRFDDMVAAVETIDFIYDSDSDTDAYFDQNYYITHLVYTITNYGEEEMESGDFRERILNYLRDNLEFVQCEIGDIDLIAEFAHCLNLLGQGDDPEVKEAVEYLVSIQKEDGSWGTKADFSGDPYDQLHPTWAVTTALHSFR